MQFANSRQEEGRWTVPGRIPLTVGRPLGLQVFGRIIPGNEHVSFPLILPEPLSPEGATSSDWLPGRQRNRPSDWPAAPSTEGFAVRYRLAWAAP